MKRVITTLAILLVVMVAGMTALVLLVNPNDFRAYMVQQVEQRSGYQLALNGELRWHVWPRLSILSGPVTLTAPGAAQPVVSAANMRLDIDLLPLLSHQLSVKQVMIKGAVVRLTADSESQRPADAPIGPKSSAPVSPADDVTRGWKFDMSHLRIADSLLVWQNRSGEQVNVRDFNLALDQTQPRLAHIELSSRINRDQRELQFSLDGDLDITDYPRRLAAAVNQFDFQLKGADLPQQGIVGKAQMNARWDIAGSNFALNDLVLNASDSELRGTLSGTLGDRPNFTGNLQAKNLNMDALLGVSDSVSSPQVLTEKRAGPAPVIAQQMAADNADSPLNAMDGKLTLTADSVLWRQIQMSKLALEATSRDGLLTVTTLTGNVDGGSFSLPGSVDVRTAQTRVMLSPQLSGVAIAPLLKGFGLPDTVSGALSLQGRFDGEGLSVADFKRAWQGQADFSLEGAQFAGLNFQQLVRRAVENSSDKVHGDSDESKPELQHIEGSATLDRGKVVFPSLAARSAMFNYSGMGSVDLEQRELDMLFGVTVTQGWSGDSTLVQRLQQTPVPLRIYGPWSAINYNLKVDQVLRQQLRDAARERLKQWMDRNPDGEKKGEVQKLMKDL